MVFFIFLIVWFACAMYASVVASEKGYKGFNWMIGGFFFGFLALIAVAGLPDKKLHSLLKQNTSKEVNSTESKLKNYFDRGE